MDTNEEDELKRDIAELEKLKQKLQEYRKKSNAYLSEETEALRIFLEKWGISQGLIAEYIEISKIDFAKILNHSVLKKTPLKKNKGLRHRQLDAIRNYLRQLIQETNEYLAREETHPSPKLEGFEEEDSAEA